MTNYPTKIPLSWSIDIQNLGEQFKTWQLPSGMQFIKYGRIPQTSLKNLQYYLQQKFPKGFILKGISENLLHNFGATTFTSFQSGISGSWELHNKNEQNFSSHRLQKKLAHQVYVSKVPPSEFYDISRFLLKRSKYSHFPEIKGLFRTEPECNAPCFTAFKYQNNQPIAGLSFTRSSAQSYHLEQFIRSAHAPSEVMDYLILKSYTYLFNLQETTSVSLGEVPFKKLSLPSRVLLLPIRHSIKKNYSYEGLYDFKAKYCNNWHKVYWYAYPRFHIRDINFLLKETNCRSLASLKLP